MNTELFTFIVVLTMLITACVPFQSAQPETIPTVAMTQSGAVVTTGQGGGPAVGLPPSTTNNDGATPISVANLPASGVSLSDNGKTFMMRLGESFLLNLGSDVYEWVVEVDRDGVLQREQGVTAIQGAQGVYTAQTPGTAILIANGDPLCLKSKPPCKLPSISFSIILIVE